MALCRLASARQAKCRPDKNRSARARSSSTPCFASTRRMAAVPECLPRTISRVQTWTQLLVRLVHHPILSILTAFRFRLAPSGPDGWTAESPTGNGLSPFALFDQLLLDKKIYQSL